MMPKSDSYEEVVKLGSWSNDGARLGAEQAACSKIELKRDGSERAKIGGDKRRLCREERGQRARGGDKGERRTVATNFRYLSLDEVTPVHHLELFN